MVGHSQQSDPSFLSFFKLRQSKFQVTGLMPFSLITNKIVNSGCFTVEFQLHRQRIEGFKLGYIVQKGAVNIWIEGMGIQRTS